MTKLFLSKIVGARCNVPLRKFSILLTLAFFTSCAAMAPGSTSPLGTSGVGELGAPAGNGLSGESGSSGNSSGGDSGGSDTGTDNFAPASLPTPNAKIDVDQIIAYNSDSNGYVPVVGAAGSVQQTNSEYTGSVQVVVTTQTASAKNEIKKSSRRQTVWAWLTDKIVGAIGRSPVLESLIQTANADASASTLCEQTATTTCCPVNSDGSFECYVPSTSSTAVTYNLYVTDTDGTAAFSVEDATGTTADLTLTQQKHLLWFKQKPKDVKTIADTHTYGSNTNAGLITVLGQDVLIPVVDNNGDLTVYGDHTNSYAEANAVGYNSLVYDPTNVYLGGVMPDGTTGGADYNMFDDSFLAGTTDPMTTNVATVQVAGTEQYNQIKYTGDGLIRFVRKPTKTQNQEYVYAITANNIDDIKFYDDARNYIIANTITFDVGSDDSAIVLFQDNNGDYRLGHANTSIAKNYHNKDKFGYNNPLNYGPNLKTLDPVDLTLYNSTGFSGTASSGNFLLLDKGNNMAWLLDYNIYDFTKINYQDPKTAKISNLLSPSKNGISTGEGPVAITYNTDKSKAYILNQGDLTVTVITLKNGTTVLPHKSITKGSIDLLQFMGSKTITFTPTSINYYEDPTDSAKKYLVVGAEGLQGGIVIDLVANPVTEKAATSNPFALPTKF